MNAPAPKPTAPDFGAEPIAIVGVGCVFPKAPNLDQYWRNILGKVDGVSDAPDDWYSPLFFDPDSTANDRVYTNRGGFLGDLARFDPLRHGVMPSSVDGGEPDQFLALEVATDAVEDAGFAQRPVAGDRVAVILGRGTYINRGFTNVVQHGVMVDRFIDILRKLHPDTSDAEAASVKDELKSSLPPFNSEMAAALVPNLVTGRISNRLDFRGANYIIDAACASSLIALERGIADLRSGACDMALVGGVHASTPAPIYQIFCQLGALSRKGNIRPFSAEADGTLLAEGVGILCIKRLSDAEAAGDRIYALVRSVGVASDGKGMSILAPRLDGERLAIQRAYEAADIDPATVGLVEAHGTATSVGDATEIESLITEFGTMTAPCALGTVKSMIGHCLPASGSAGLIKTALALHHRVLPPTLIETSNPDLGLEGTGFYLNTETRPWIHGRPTPRRAGVNAFGFGGINAHAVLEEYTAAPEPRPVIDRASELILFDAPDAGAAVGMLDQIAARITAAPDFADVAREICAEAGQGRCKLAVVAATGAEAVGKLELLRQGLDKGRKRLRDRRGAYFSTDPLAETGKIAFLFPGEGSQYRNMLSPLMLQFPRMRHWFDLVDGAYADGQRDAVPSDVFFPPPGQPEGDIWRMDVGPEAIFAANMAMATLYDQIGLKPDMTVGHSTGEYAALFAAGVTARADPAMLQREIRDLNAVFEAAAAEGDITAGTLFTIGPVNAEKLRARIATREDVFLGMDNCPGQQVVAATTPEGAAWVAKMGVELGGYCEELPFARAYHCPAFRPFSDRLRGFLADTEVAAPVRPVYSCLTAATFPSDPVQIREMIADQWSGEVRFTETIRNMYDDGARIFVECGPRNNLTAFANDILRKKPTLAVAADTTARDGLEQLHHMAAQLLVEGVPLDLAALTAPAMVQRGSAKAKPLKMGMQPMELSDKPRPKRAPRVEAPESTPSAPAPQPTPMDAMMSGYFDTLNAFLATEQQVMSAFLTGGGQGTDPQSATPNPVAAQSVDAARFPMLAHVDIAADQQSLTGRIDLSHAIAPYLSDHSFGRATSINDPTRHGLSVVPLTFTMEALAEGAAALRPDLQVVGMREIRGSRWISVEKPHQEALELTAQVIAEGDTVVIRTRLRDAAGPVIRPVIAEGDIELRASRRTPPPAPAFTPTAPKPASWTLGDVYSRIMFHGPRLQAVESLDLIGPDAAEGGLIGLPHDGLFAATAAPQFETDAITLDAVGQLVGVWSADQLDDAFHIFPFRVEHVEIFRDRLAPGERARCQCDIALVGADEMRSDISVVTQDGHLQSRITGWWDKRFDLPDGFFRARLDPARNGISTTLVPVPALAGVQMTLCDAVSDDLLAGSGGIWAGVLAGLILSDAEASQWAALTGSEASRFAWLRGRTATKDAIRAWRGTDLYPADLTLGDAPDGQITGWPTDWGVPPRIATAQAGDLSVAVAVNPDRYDGVGLSIIAAQNDPDQWGPLACAAAAALVNSPDAATSGRLLVTEIENSGQIVWIQDAMSGTTIETHIREETASGILIAMAVPAQKLERRKEHRS